MKLTSKLDGKTRGKNSGGAFCVSPREFQRIGWNTDTARYAAIDGKNVKVTIVADSLVWEGDWEGSR